MVAWILFVVYVHISLWNDIIDNQLVFILLKFSFFEHLEVGRLFIDLWISLYVFFEHLFKCLVVLKKKFGFIHFINKLNYKWIKPPKTCWFKNSGILRTRFWTTTQPFQWPPSSTNIQRFWKLVSTNPTWLTSIPNWQLIFWSWESVNSQMRGEVI